METELGSKVCFVTIGATAAFDALIKAALDESFLEALVDLNYSDLRLQYGKDGSHLLNKFAQPPNVYRNEEKRLNVTGFDLKTGGIRQDYLAARNGVVISHAGSGSVLEALRLAIPLIVVPNPTLLDNHQAELAEEMAAQGYAVHGKLDGLVRALRQAEVLRKRLSDWPPRTTSGDGRGLTGVMDDELGFVD